MSRVPTDKTELRKMLADLFANPNLLPPSLLSFLNDYNALNQPPIPASNIIGILNYVERVDQNTDTVVVDVGSTTSIYNFTLPGGLLQTKGAIRIDISGLYKNNTGAGRTLELLVILGASTLYYGTTSAIASSANTRAFDLSVILGNNGSATIQKLTGHFDLSDSGIPGTGFGLPLGGDGSSFAGPDVGAEGVNTKLPQTLSILVKHPITSANLVLTKLFAYTTRIAH